MSGRTQAPGSALRRHPHCAATDHARLPLSGLPSGQAQVQGLPQATLPEQPAAAHALASRAMIALMQLRVPLLASITAFTATINLFQSRIRNQVYAKPLPSSFTFQEETLIEPLLPT